MQSRYHKFLTLDEVFSLLWIKYGKPNENDEVSKTCEPYSLCNLGNRTLLSLRKPRILINVVTFKVHSRILTQVKASFRHLLGVTLLGRNWYNWYIITLLFRGSEHYRFFVRFERKSRIYFGSITIHGFILRHRIGWLDNITLEL